MSTIFLESFDLYSSPDNMPAKGWVLGGAGDAHNLVAGRTGNALQCTNGALGNTLSYSLYGNAHQTVTVGVAIMIGGPADIPLIAFDSGFQLTLEGVALTSNFGDCGHLEVGIWHYVEMLVTLGTGTAGYAEIAIDGGVTLAAHGTTGTAATTTAINFDTWYSLFGTSAVYFDDLYITNGAGTVDTGRLGDIRVPVLLPNGNGDLSQLENSSGNFTNNYSYVNSPYQTSTFVASNTVGNEDTYQLADVPWPAGDVAAVQACVLAAKDNAGSRAVEPVLRIAGADHAGSSQTLALSPLYATTIWDVNPATGVPWTITDVNDTQLGARVE